MNHKVRNNFAVAAVGALACSLAFQPVASAAQSTITDDPGNNVDVATGTYKGRLSGEDRFGTAISAAKAFANPGATVILANYDAWADTLAATPMSDALDAPVLYTWANKLDSKTKAYLAGSKFKNVTLIGGEGVINPSVVAELEAMGFNVDRIGGATRYDSALLLAAEAVDLYNGNTQLADARFAIESIKKAEARYQAALAAWETARAQTAAAFDAKVKAEAELAAANAALQKLIESLVEVPSTTVTFPDGSTREVTSLEEYNNTLVELRNYVADHAALENFVNDRLAEYVAGNNPDFQNDVWNTAVVPFFGATQFTVKLSTGTYTGTLAQLSATTPILKDAVAAGGAATTVKQVEVYLNHGVVEGQKLVDIEQGRYAAVVARLVERADAIAANEALQRKIAAAYKDVQAAEANLTAKGIALNDARTNEFNKWDDFLDAAEDRRSGDAAKDAQLAYENTLTAVLKSGKKYPAFLATGLDFADALAAGPAASAEAGVVLLTRGSQMEATTQRYLDNGANLVGVGGPASASSSKISVKYVGANRYETATKLAAAYFDPSKYVGLASGVVAADAVIAGAFMANVDGTLVLTRPTSLPTETSYFLSYKVDNPDLVVFGGPGAISNGVKAEAIEALSN